MRTLKHRLMFLDSWDLNYALPDLFGYFQPFFLYTSDFYEYIFSKNREICNKNQELLKATTTPTAIHCHANFQNESLRLHAFK